MIYAASTQTDARRTDSQISMDRLRPHAGEASNVVPESHPYEQFVNPHLAALLHKLRLDKRFVRGEGCALYDASGRRYLDCIAAYGALPFGFNPPAIWEALLEVRDSGEPSLIQPSLLDAAGELAQKLVALAPETLRYVTFANSGAEAVEAAIKICRAATKRVGILSTRNSFHGKTLGALSATGNPNYQNGFSAPVEGFACIPFGDAEALRRALAEKPGYFAAFLVEPIQGEGGIVEAPAGYLAAARKICDEAGVLLVFDEIQSGLGRTGTLLASQHDNVVPDVVTLAKALGGGLMPIGAVLYNQAAYTPDFALKHSSTFAGNALACRAGIAALELLVRDEQRLLRAVAENGQRLKAGLLHLQQRFPQLIAEIRGRGYMLGIELETSREAWPESLLGVAAEQNFLAPVFSSYLLNVEGVRVAPTLNGKNVIRIEPALVFDWQQCQQLLTALENTLQVFASGETGRILGSIFDGKPRSNRLRVVAAPPRRAVANPTPQEARFGFLVHPLNLAGYRDFDPTLGSLNDDELAQAAGSLSGLVEPFVLSEARVVSADGTSIYGEFVAVPWTAEEMQRMSRPTAVAAIRSGVELAQSRGAQMVGLGAFTSIVTRGGLDVSRVGVAVTTGNSYSAVSSIDAVGLALEKLGGGFGKHLTAGVLGSSGAIGRAIVLLLADKVGRLVLVGNSERAADVVRQRLLGVARDMCQHVAMLHAEGRSFAHGTIAECIVQGSGDHLHPIDPMRGFDRVIESLERCGRLLITQNPGALAAADVVVTATSATECCLTERDLRAGAIVCDLSRPANVSKEVAAAREDVVVLDGGIIAVPGKPDLGRLGLDHGLCYACMAETMMLTLDRQLRNMSLGTDLSSENLRLMQTLASRHGFRVAQLRSFGRPLEEADWKRLLHARSRMAKSGMSAAA